MSTLLPNITTVYNIGTNQQPYNFYMLDNSNNNFIFECTTLDIESSLHIVPSFTNYFTVPGVGFSNVSQTAVLNITAQDLSGLFVFSPVNSNIFDITQMDQMQYGVSAEVFHNFAFSKSNVSTMPVYTDYITSLVYSITNGTNTQTSLFKNLDQMQSDIQLLDAKFNIALNQNIHQNKYNASTHKYDKTLFYTDENAYALACKQLITGILSLTNLDRQAKFIEDINLQTAPFKVVFHKGDSISIRIAYVPKNGNASSIPGLNSTIYNNMLYTRTYKIIMNVVSEN